MVLAFELLGIGWAGNRNSVRPHQAFGALDRIEVDWIGKRRMTALGSAPTHGNADALQASAGPPAESEIERLYSRELLRGAPDDVLATPASSADSGPARLIRWLKGARDETVEDRALRWVDAHCAPFIAALDDAADQQRGTIVLIASRLTYKVYREARALRPRGFRTALVVLEPLSPELHASFANAFDAVCELPKCFLLLRALAGRLRADVFHVHCRMLEYLAARAVNEGRSGGRLVCELDDITSVYAPRSVMRCHWPPDLVDLDFASETYICRHADGLVHQFDQGVEALLESRHGALPATIGMQPYPLTEQCVSVEPRSKRDGILRCVWAGQVWPPNEENPREMYPVAGVLPVFESLCRQGFGVEVYCDPAKGTLLEDPTFAPYHALRRYPGFHFGLGTTPDRIAGHIAHCDFGLVLCELDLDSSALCPEKFELQIPNKVFTYFEAGLPVIVNAEYTSLARMVADNRLGIAVSSADVPKVAEIVSRTDVEEMRQNVEAFASANTMERHIDRLIALSEGARP